MKIENVLEVITTSKSPRHFNELIAHFELFQTERDSLAHHLEILSQYKLIEESKPHTYQATGQDLIGTVVMNARGFGFVTPERFEAANIFVNVDDLADARHKDRVLVELYTARDGRYRGKIKKVLERGMQSCVGIYRQQDGQAWLSPQNDQLPSSIKIITPLESDFKLENVEEGSLLAVALSDQGTQDSNLIAIPMHVVNPGDPQGQLEMVIYNQGINLSLSREAQAYAEQFSEPASSQDSQEYDRRRDLRHLPFITIDPNSAKDFDDALYVQARKQGGWVLWVAIADVAHYVSAGDPIDQEAREKSATLYLPAQAFPMLPHRLSNDLCSLKPRVDRLAMVARIEISVQGDIEEASFHESIIHSKARLTYDEAATLLGILPKQKLAKHITRQLHNVTSIRDCSRALKKRRKRRGFLNLDLIEPRLNFDMSGMVEGFKTSPRHEAHEMVEECMLAANESVAMHCIKEKIPGLYRLHASPPERNLERFTAQARLLGAPLESKKMVKAHHLSQYLKNYETHPRGELLSSLLLRAMSRAAYRSQPGLHFGLGTHTYLHFTSPIRRYPDLWVHRQLKAWLNREQGDESESVPLDAATPSQVHEQANEVAGYASRRERIIMEAERKVLDAYKALFMKDYIGEIYQGIICSCSPKGFLVDLKDYPIWCTHEADRLPGSFRYEESLFMWRDVVSKRRLSLGSEVSVRLINSDISTGRIEVILDEL